MPPAARLSDMHVCPKVTPLPHVGGPITGPSVTTVLVGSLPAAVVGDTAVCVGPPDTIVQVLDGFTVGITADRRWEEQAGLFERRGALIQNGPVIRTLPLGAEDRLRAATETLVSGPPAFLVANTGIGIRSWFAAADSWELDEPLNAALAATAIYARCPKASAAIHGRSASTFAASVTMVLNDVSSSSHNCSDCSPVNRLPFITIGNSASSSLTSVNDSLNCLA